jgi:transposase
MTKGTVKMNIVNPNAAGIDIGSKSHFVAVGQANDEIQEFGVYDEDLKSICKYLNDFEIKTVALESTGDYWQTLFTELINHDFEVILVNGKFTKNAKGKKTDVKDARWIQQLHTLGLLSSSFLPDYETEIIRTYYRQRSNTIRLIAKSSSKMQKYLKFLNFRLDVVVNDVCGLTGLKIIEDICEGNLDPYKLAKHRHFACKKTEEEIAKALHGNNRMDFIFGLQQEFKTYKFFKRQLVQCDKEIEKALNLFLKKSPEKKKFKISANPYKRKNKNAPEIKNFTKKAYQYFGGVDLMAIEGVSHITVLGIMSEIGEEGFFKFKTAKHFTSWLRLAPNNKISGGKVLSNKLPKGSNRLKIALRQAANSIGNLKDTELSDFFKRIAYRRGRQAAVSATARKLAVIIWNMITKKQPYNPSKIYMFRDEKRKLGLIKRMRKQIVKFDINPADVGFLTT